MKKYLLSIITIGLTVAATAQQRMVLYEEFTGENCNPCAAANPGLWSLLSSSTNSSKLAAITFMEPIPSAGYFYYSAQSVNDNRMMSYYNSLYLALGYYFTPSGVLDGYFPDSTGGNKGSVTELTQTDIDNEAAVASPFNMTATETFNDTKDSVTVKVDITAVTAVTGTLKLRAAWVKNMDFSRPPGTNGENHFDNVVRKMVPTPAGTFIPGSWTAGTTHSYTLTTNITGLDTFTNVSSTDSFMVVWIQNDANKYVLQVAKATPSTGVNIVKAATLGMQLYPNPANNEVLLTLNLNKPSNVGIEITDMLGRVIKTIDAGKIAPGKQDLHVDTHELAAGTYNVTVKTAIAAETQRLSIVK